MRIQLCTAALLGALVLPAGAAPPRALLSPALERALSADSPTVDHAVWIYFSDKSPAASLSAVEATLTPHARARRERNRGRAHLVDDLDRPVNATYVAALRNRGVRVRQVSRWLNAVSVDADAGGIERVATLPFVSHMDVVRGGRSQLPRPTQEPGPLAPPAILGPASLDYGSAASQIQTIHVDVLHDQGLSGAGVWICMMDGGVNNLAHNAFA
ncbi:MAG TPA: hypothetical protein VFX92_02265, partial [Candidatus Krumholzibacteria bacterium]|nr:hypothetical protein [Candidatus Krumholzibacteria bacterium]